VTLGDFSQPEWLLAPDWQRTSAINGVQAILTGLVTSPEQSHEAWCREKRATGWRHGSTKDPEAKTHPCLVSYADLPAVQRIKDRLFFAIVATLADLPPVPPSDVLRAEQLDRHGVVFGLKSVPVGPKSVPGGPTEMVTLYVGDDGWWHPKATVAAEWMPELLRVVGGKRWPTGDAAVK
jgi:hypothetical protein